MNNLFTLILLIATITFISCDEENTTPVDYGYEEGFFIYDLELNKIPWKRDRNFLSLKFKNDVSEENIKDILNDYGLIANDRVITTKHFIVKCVSNPAEYYYSNTAVESESELDDLPEVEYSLPVFISENGGIILLTDVVRIKFEGIEKNREMEILDSLMSTDNLFLDRDTDSKGQTYHLKTLKTNLENSLQRSNRYSLIENVRFAIPDYAFQTF
ncbi:MAG: hypothetical protein ROO71_01810 [Balneola sp.]